MKLSTMFATYISMITTLSSTYVVPPRLSHFITSCYTKLGWSVIERTSIWTIYCTLLDCVRLCEGLQATLEASKDYGLHDEDELPLILYLQDLCYARHTLVGQGETKVVLREVLTKRRCFLKEQQRIIKSKEFECLRSKANCSWTQENARLCRSRMRTTIHAADYFIV